MKHLVSLTDLTKEDILELLNLAVEMQVVNGREVKKLPALNGRTVVNLFFEDSTRTRVSFELAAKRLSADVVNVSAKGSSVSKGESLKDTIQTLDAMGVDAIVMRHHHSGAAKIVADNAWSSGAIVNAGDGTHEHPTQGLLDALTIRSELLGRTSTGDLDGLRVLIVGDVLHSRVARSNAIALRKLGASVAFCGPATLVPDSAINLVDEIYFDLDTALAQNFDVVMMLRIQKERMNSAFIPNPAEYGALYGLTSVRFAKLAQNTLIMHPGPMNRGLEISSEAADSAQSVIKKQVTNGVAMRMAVLYRLLAQESK